MAISVTSSSIPVYPNRTSLPLRTLSPLWSRWTYTRLIYLGLAFPLGLLYFISLVVGLAVGGSLAWTIPGLALLIVVVLAAATIEDGPAAMPARAAQHASIASLTPREREVLLLIARGYSNAEIAEASVVSEGTVKTHVKRILAKLEARDRTQAAVFAFDCGFVTPESASEPEAR